MSDLADHGAARRTATLLFEGWGYNKYRRENLLRADDLLVRARVSELLSRARARLGALESAYRRAHLPAPTRANPYPDPASIAQAQALTRAGEEIGAIEGLIRAAPAPERDEVWRRHRGEAATLTALAIIDTEMVEHAIALEDFLAAGDEAAAAAPGFPAEVSAHITPLSAKVRERADFLRLRLV